MANVFEQAKRKARETSILDVARRHGVLNRLKKVGDEYTGPCPLCGGTNRFAINPRKLGKNGKHGLFLCRQCREGGDVIDFERFLRGTKFKDAPKDLSGAAIVEEDPGEAARRARRWAFCRAVSRRRSLASGPSWARRERSISATNAPSTPACQRSDGRWRPLRPSAGIHRSTSRKRTLTSLSMSCTGGVSVASSGS